MDRRTKKRRVGDLGEDIACKYLTGKGFKVFTRNYLRPWGEIDIVAQKENNTHFVEVKSVSRENFDQEEGGYRPEENMHVFKLRRLSRVVQTYIAENGVNEWQIDLVTVLIDEKGKRAKVELFENVLSE